MPELSLDILDRHWAGCTKAFRTQHQPWEDLLDRALVVTSGFLSSLEGKRALAENCTYLLLSKSVNHLLGLWRLASVGLNVDACLCARGALETLLLLQVCLLDPEEKCFEQWAAGKEFKPAWVRRELNAISEVAVRGIVYTCTPEEENENAFVYAWLSKVTHANIDSLNYSVRAGSGGSYEVITGGDPQGAAAIVNAIFAVSLSRLTMTTILGSCILSMDWFEENRNKLSELNASVHSIAEKYIEEAGGFNFEVQQEQDA